MRWTSESFEGPFRKHLRKYIQHLERCEIPFPMCSSLFRYSMWRQQASPQLLRDRPGRAGCRCSVAPSSPLQMSAHLRRAVGRIRLKESLRDMFAEPTTSVWTLFKRAAGDSGKTSPSWPGLTRTGTACLRTIAGGTRRNRRHRILGWLKELKRLTVRIPLIPPPRVIWFTVAGVVQRARR